MGQLDGNVALVTGAASGFGAGIARAYIREGAMVVIADINIAAAQALAQELGGNAAAVACDVTNADQIKGSVALSGVTVSVR